ncbi:hypothetical protein J1605_001504 [Eschrichtius robustus]|uniref:Coiled-coil domain-containing protein 81 n=1 Tax=Eschrichtius robustus TaxID=9764 RepID=A0AB34I738_ESCRO|nr:hypothetical protein J1605_001504 [Eschrichtius robustus]
MLDTIVPSLQDLGRHVLHTLPSLSKEEVSTIWGHVSEFVERQLSLHKRPDTVDSVLSSRESLGKRPNSMLSFPRIELKEMENKLPMETTVEEGGQNGQRKSKLKDQSDKEEGVREILSPKVIQDRQAISPAKATNVSFPQKLEQNGSGGKNTNIERLPSLGGLKNDNEMKPKIPPATSCQDHNRAGQRNSPLYYSEERKRREVEDERLLQQYQMLKDQEALFKEQPSHFSKWYHQPDSCMNPIPKSDPRLLLLSPPHPTICKPTCLHLQKIKNKRPQLPMFEPDSSEPIFGKEEGEPMVEKRKREQNYMRHQLEAAANHKRTAILHQLVDQKWDLLMLQRTHKEHLADRNAELERVSRIYQNLQDDWERSAVMKKQRDLEEKAFERASSKLFLLDQCEKYRRCKQCQRRPSNVGKSNLWPLNKYMHGSRLFV